MTKVAQAASTHRQCQVVCRRGCRLSVMFTRHYVLDGGCHWGARMDKYVNYLLHFHLAAKNIEAVVDIRGLCFSRQVVLEHVEQMAGSMNFVRTIAKFDSNFSQLLVDLLGSIMDGVGVTNHTTILHR